MDENKKSPPTVIWLHPEAEHYRWLRPAGKGTKLDSLLPKQYIHLVAPSQHSPQLSHGAGGRSVAHSRSCRDSAASMLGLQQSMLTKVHTTARYREAALMLGLQPHARSSTKHTRGHSSGTRSACCLGLWYGTTP
eukprot:2475404-Amphidinium_carterae.3